MVIKLNNSLTCEIETNNFHEGFYKKTKKSRMLANIQKNSKFYDKANKKVMGKIKDETKGIPIVGFIGLKFKMY